MQQTTIGTKKQIVIPKEIRKKIKAFKPEAIQLATAIHAKADIFINNDDRLTNCKEIKVKVLK